MTRTTRTILPLLFGTMIGVSAAHPAYARGTDDACIAAANKATESFRAGKLLDARAALSMCAASSCLDPVGASCRQRLADVSQAIPSVVFFAKDGGGHDLASVKVTIDAAAPVPLTGTAVDLDPGSHEVRFEAAGEDPVVRRLVLHQGEKNRREDVFFGGAPPSSSPDRGSSPLRTVGIVVGVVGVAGIAVGSVFGALALSTKGSDCPNGVCQTGSDRTAAETQATVSTVAFIAGGLLLAGGVTMFFVAPRKSEQPAASLFLKPLLGPRAGGLQLGARW